MKLFKLLIPKEKAQIVTELESWTVTWYIRTGWSNDTQHFAKVFIKEADAIEFNKQLNESAKFIRCWIRTDISGN